MVILPKSKFDAEPPVDADETSSVFNNVREGRGKSWGDSGIIVSSTAAATSSTSPSPSPSPSPCQRVELQHEGLHVDAVVDIPENIFIIVIIASTSWI